MPSDSIPVWILESSEDGEAAAAAATAAAAVAEKPDCTRLGRLRRVAAAGSASASAACCIRVFIFSPAKCRLPPTALCGRAAAGVLRDGELFDGEMALLSVVGETAALLPVASGKSLAADFGRLIGEMLLLEDIAARATRRGLQTKRRRPTHASQHLRNES